MKKQNLLTRMLLLCALVVGSVSAWAEDEPEITFDLTTAWTAGSDSDGEKVFTKEIDGTTYTISGKGETNFKFNSGYFFFGKNGAYVKLPAFSFPVSKIVVIGNGAGSAAVKMNIYVGEDAVSTETTGCGTGDSKTGTASTLTYNIAEASQTAGTRYQLQVTSKHNAQITSIKIYKAEEAVTKHTLYSAVNPVGVGTVTLGATEVGEGKSTTIVAEAANANYRFKNWTKTSGAIADENAASTTFTMGTTDATVTANFEEIPSHSLSYIVTPTGAGTVTLSSSSVKEDATATAEAAANAGYKFTGWSISGTGATLSSTTDNPTTVTMGTADAIVTANFTAVTTYAISWNVNGTVVKRDYVEENTSITFPTSIEGIPAGYVLKGWSTAEVITPQENEPATKVTSATSTAATTYYAILAVEIGTPVTFARYEKVTAAQDDWSGTYILASTYDGGSDESKKGTWVYTAPASSKKYGEIAAIGDLTTEASDYELVIAKSTNGYTIYHTNSKLYFAYNGSNNQLDFAESVTDTKQEWTITGVAVITNAQSTSRVLKYNGSSPRFACYTSGQTATDLYKRIEEGGVSYSNYCTTIPAISVTVTDAKYATFSDNTARDFSGSGITVYAAKADGTKVELEEVTDGIVPANTGVVLYAASATTKSIPAIATDKTSLADNEMVANVAAATVKYAGEGDKKNFILAKEDAGVGFYAATADGATLAANRAYLSTTSVPASGARFLGFDNDMTTSIQSVGNARQADDRVFNLAGQRVAQPVKGLYIVNGKKVVVK